MRGRVLLIASIAAVVLFAGPDSATPKETEQERRARKQAELDDYRRQRDERKRKEEQFKRDQRSAFVPAEKSDAAWAAAQACVATVAPRTVFPITLATDTVINTERGRDARVWMTVVRSIEADGRVRIEFDSGSTDLFMNSGRDLRQKCLTRVKEAAGD